MSKSGTNRNQRGASKAPSATKEETSLEFGSLLDMELQEWEPQLLEWDNTQLEELEPLEFDSSLLEWDSSLLQEWEPLDMEPLEEWIEESVKDFNSEQNGNEPN